MASDSGLDFSFAPIHPVVANSNENPDAQLLGKLLLCAIEDKDCMMYCAYTIHPKISEHSDHPPDWVKVNTARRSFPKVHILGRILELSTNGAAVIAKLLQLAMLRR